MINRRAILWIRNDFRLNDNFALEEASKFEEVIPVYIWNEKNPNPWKPGAASKWWLHQTLTNFKKRLISLGSNLIVIRGTPESELVKLAKQSKPTLVLWNRNYDPSEAKSVANVTKALSNIDIPFCTFQGNLLYNPNDLLKKDGSPYLVYTPFWRNFLTKYSPRMLAKPKKMPRIPKEFLDWGHEINELNLLPKLSWHEEFHNHWQPGEDSALKKIRLFLKNQVDTYNKDRDLPAVNGTSQLSPYLHFGEIHPQRILCMIFKEFGAIENIRDPNIVQFCKEIIWREFSYNLLQHFPKTPHLPLREGFKQFPWKKNKLMFNAWTKGQTGYPIVDAGMRQLWKTGWMHNRVRMITASFLIKHLNIPWQEGAKWFWDTLVDADLASNTQGWQWTAGCGADASPFFRIFNPITQGEKFDPEGEYAKKWCPELAGIPKKWIYKPWEAPKEALNQAGVQLGINYPLPIVDHKEAREKALCNYQLMKKTQPLIGG